jgi:hypothetical protein
VVQRIKNGPFLRRCNFDLLLLLPPSFFNILHALRTKGSTEPVEESEKLLLQTCISRTHETGGGLAGWAGGGTTRGTGAFFSAGADLDFALAAKARTKVRADVSDRESI